MQIIRKIMQIKFCMFICFHSFLKFPFQNPAMLFQVIVTLLGEQGNSKPHHLTDPKKPLFERGAVDLFLLTTPYSLGELEGIRLWHNNSGSHPAWYKTITLSQKDMIYVPTTAVIVTTKQAGRTSLH